jgi:2Fe-2S ferredoxin
MAARIHVTLVDAAGAAQRIEARGGASLMKAAVAAGIDGIAADCGGVLSCATCHVFVDAAWLPRMPLPSADERAMLEMTAAPARPASRLACQILLDESHDGLVVHLPPTQY